MADQINPLAVNHELPADFLDQCPQVTNVVNVGVPLVAAGIGTGPEFTTFRINEAVRVAVEESPALCQGLKLHPILLRSACVTVAMEKDHEWHRCLAIITRGNK